MSVVGIQYTDAMRYKHCLVSCALYLYLASTTFGRYEMKYDIYRS